MKYLADVQNEIISNVNEIIKISYNKKELRLTPEIKSIIHKTAIIGKGTNIYNQTADKRYKLIKDIKPTRRYRRMSTDDLFRTIMEKLNKSTSDASAAIIVIWTFPVLDDYIRGKI